MADTGTVPAEAPPRQRRDEPLSLLPGPVPLPPPVAAALSGAPQAHRRPEALARLDRVRALLRARTGAQHVAVLTGSGTTANDLIAAQLRLRGGRGLVLVAGEFGGRLADAARRARLDVDVLHAPEGRVVQPGQLADALARRPADWTWTVHCETSTGALFDLPGLLRACRSAGSELVVDAISTLGCAPVDLRGVLLAAASSGKALAGFPGLALVLARDAPRSAPDLPRSLDLHAFHSGDGTPCTLPTALVAGLEAALDARPADDEPAALEALAATGTWLRRALVAHGLALVADERCASPAVVSVRLPRGTDPVRLAELVAADGFLLAAHSGYLRDRGWVQISLMSRPCADDLRELPGRLAARVRVLQPA
jgi:aspartate aminotransferase-like enzyme